MCGTDANGLVSKQKFVEVSFGGKLRNSYFWVTLVARAKMKIVLISDNYTNTITRFCKN